MRGQVGAVLAAGLLVVAVGLALVLLESKPRQAGTNYIPEFERALTIKGSGTYCQDRQVVPADAAGLRLLVGTFGRPTPTLGVTVRDGAEELSAGRLPAGRGEGHVVVPVERVDRLEPDARVCIDVERAAKARRTVLYGAAGQVRFEWLRPESESWLQLLPTVAHRFGLGKPFLAGGWVLLLAGLLLLTGWALALRLTLRELSR